MKAADVVSRSVDYIKPTDPVKNAAHIFASRVTNIIPVCRGKRLVGIITERDILNAIFPMVNGQKKKNENLDTLKEKTPGVLALPVSQIMNPKPTTVTPNTDIKRVLEKMRTTGTEKITVVV
jgi:CBS domain-containing protein